MLDWHPGHSSLTIAVKSVGEIASTLREGVNSIAALSVVTFPCMCCKKHMLEMNSRSDDSFLLVPGQILHVA